MGNREGGRRKKGEKKKRKVEMIVGQMNRMVKLKVNSKNEQSRAVRCENRRRSDES